MSPLSNVVDEAHACGEIDYGEEDQVMAVLEIVNLIDQDPTVAVVTRLIKSFNRVSNCRRNNKKNLSVFVSRFCGLTEENLMHTNLLRLK